MVRWRKSTHSGSENHTSCVEVAALPQAIAVRDSKNPNGPQLRFEVEVWRGFLKGVRGDA